MVVGLWPAERGGETGERLLLDLWSGVVLQWVLLGEAVEEGEMLSRARMLAMEKEPLEFCSAGFAPGGAEAAVLVGAGASPVV